LLSGVFIDVVVYHSMIALSFLDRLLMHYAVLAFSKLNSSRASINHANAAAASRIRTK